MSALSILAEFEAQGVELIVDGDKLRWRGPKTVKTPDAIEKLKRHKADLIEALQTPSVDDFAERAAIAEYDGGLSRDEAEQLAANEQGFDTVDDLARAVVAGWRAEIERVAPDAASDFARQCVTDAGISKLGGACTKIIRNINENRR